MSESMFPLIMMIWVAAAWLTHIVFCITYAKWIFLLAGAIFFPIGCVHGTGIWFGWF